MSTIRCDYKKCGKLFNKTPSKIKRDKNHFCSYECKALFRKENEYKYTPHNMNKHPFHRIKNWAKVREEHRLNDFDVDQPVFQ
jgi:hypothetical protein